jgi:uncharacterized protein VirK/YbjX
MRSAPLASRLTSSSPPPAAEDQAVPPPPAAEDQAVPPLATWLRQLGAVARQTHPGVSPIALWRAGHLFMQQLMCWRELRSWHSAATPALRAIVRHRPSIVCAVGRPYINTAWGGTRRLAAIRQHYTLLSTALKVLDFGPADRLSLASTPAGTGRLELVLDMPMWFAHEGELALNLFFKGRRVYSLVFSLGSEEGRLTAYIGALQGLGGIEARPMYRDLTHGLHGLRPRELLLAVFRMLCRCLGVERMLAVSDLRRPASSAYFATCSAVLTSYDAVWQAHGGLLGSEGFFELPLVLARRSADSVPGRKRAQYRRRYEMLDGLQAEVGRSLMAD